MLQKFSNRFLKRVNALKASDRQSYYSQTSFERTQNYENQSKVKWTLINDALAFCLVPKFRL